MGQRFRFGRSSKVGSRARSKRPRCRKRGSVFSRFSFRRMSKRQFVAAEPELMDRPNAAPAEIEAALSSLRGLNRYFGSYRVVRRFLRRWIRPRDDLRVLD